MQRFQFENRLKGEGGTYCVLRLSTLNDSDKLAVT